MDSYNYYLFDLDGTISESAPGIVKAVKYGLDQAGNATDVVRIPLDG